ncbi:MAG TPA: phospholipase [Firmicutes bacterium]|nr:phospholipase [Candidatus Fermentithermobacillaceae bacterium]
MQTERTYLSLLGDLGNRIAKTVKAQFFVRFIGTPFQKLLDKSGKTHRFLTELAVKVLTNDGYEEAAAFMKKRLDKIIKGNYWADSLWMNSTHHYNPRTKRGLWIWPGAADQIKNWFSLATSLWDKDIEKSMFVLGACLHIVQDCCQPYHSNGRVFQGHQKYEKWVDKNKELFAVEEGGIYRLSETPEGWAIANAEFSAPYIDAVSGPSEKAKMEATSLLIPRAIRTTAGFMLFFLEHVRGEILEPCPQS